MLEENVMLEENMMRRTSATRSRTACRLEETSDIIAVKCSSAIVTVSIAMGPRVRVAMRLRSSP